MPLPLRERIHFTKKYSSQDYQGDHDHADDTNDDASEQSLPSSSSSEESCDKEVE